MTGYVTDLSHHQAHADLAAMRADGCAGLILKATEGTSYRDASFPARARQATALGLPWTAYHYAKPGTSDPVAQAEHLMATAGRDRALVLDLEEAGGLGPAPLAAWALGFCRHLERTTGRTPIIYTGLAFMAERVAPIPQLARYPLWLARYTSAPATRTPSPWAHWSLWQYADGAPTPGVGPCDRSRTAPGVDVAQLFGLTTPATHPQEFTVDKDAEKRFDRLDKAVAACARGILIGISESRDDATKAELAQLARSLEGR